MVKTASTMLPLGHKAPDFSLPEVISGEKVSLASFEDKDALLVMFICRHCPFVIHVQNELAKLGRDYEGSKLGIVAISSNDVKNYPEDSLENLANMKNELGFVFPYLLDETQEVAKAYLAACTPDFFLFDSSRELVYRGQLDDSRPGNGAPIDGRDLRGAIDALLGGGEVAEDQKPSIGCNIKWRPGNEPSYFG